MFHAMSFLKANKKKNLVRGLRHLRAQPELQSVNVAGCVRLTRHSAGYLAELKGSVGDVEQARGTAGGTGRRWWSCRICARTMIRRMEERKRRMEERMAF